MEEIIEKSIKEVESKINSITFKKKQVNFKRAPLIKLSLKEEDSEKGYLFGEALQNIYSKISDNTIIKKSVASNKLEYYFYNCETTRDYGWGCSWRCIQSIIGTIRNILLDEEEFENNLSNFSNLINFENRFDTLFYTYGNKDLLLKLFSACYKFNATPEYLVNKEFAPHETEFGWAEPFIGRLILQDFGIECDLLLLNEYKNFALAPIEVFDKTICFVELKVLLLNHFNNPFPVPIYIDDTILTFCIIGAVEENDVLKIMILDPNIKNVDDCEKGIYVNNFDKDGANIDSNNKLLRKLNLNKNSLMILIPKLPQAI
jgi:hypothetical protein